MSDTRPILERAKETQARVPEGYTEGPWEAHRHDDPEGMGDINWQVQQDIPPAVVLCNICESDNPNNRTDARLIALAPDLARDLGAVLEVVSEQAKSIDSLHRKGCEWYEDLVKTMVRADQVEASAQQAERERDEALAESRGEVATEQQARAAAEAEVAALREAAAGMAICLDASSCSGQHCPKDAGCPLAAYRAHQATTHAAYTVPADHQHLPRANRRGCDDIGGAKLPRDVVEGVAGGDWPDDDDDEVSEGGFDAPCSCRPDCAAHQATTPEPGGGMTMLYKKNEREWRFAVSPYTPATPEDLAADPAVQALIADAVRREREAVVAWLRQSCEGATPTSCAIALEQTSDENTQEKA